MNEGLEDRKQNLFQNVFLLVNNNNDHLPPMRIVGTRNSMSQVGMVHIQSTYFLFMIANEDGNNFIYHAPKHEAPLPLVSIARGDG